MTVDHLKEVLSLYHNKWSKHYPAERQDTANLDPRNKEKVLSHTMWMCEQALGFLQDPVSVPGSDVMLTARLEQDKLNQRKVEKAMRWLGFIQGMLFYTGHYTIDEMRAHSASPDEP